MCSVQTYYSRDRRIKRLEVIGEKGNLFEFIEQKCFSVPEKVFGIFHSNLKFLSSLENVQFYYVICTVKEIRPEPTLSIM